MKIDTKPTANPCTLVITSGGHATYGGYRNYEPHATSDTGKGVPDLRGIQGYFDGSSKLVGANDFAFIHQFFDDAQLTLVGLTPDDAFTGNKPMHSKCIRDESICVVYLANPDHPSPERAQADDATPSVDVLLPAETVAKWFDPSSGK